MTICALTFLPTQVEGTIIIFSLFIFSNLLNLLFYTDQRNERDCEGFAQSAGITNTESCTCNGLTTLLLNCRPANEEACLSSSNATYCTNSIRYLAYSTPRIRLAFSTPPGLQQQNSDLFFNDTSTEITRIQLLFALDTSKNYTQCEVGITTLSTARSVECGSCQICENGLDFTYDCSNIPVEVKGPNSTESTPSFGPKSDTCIPVTSVFASF
jgi:hypothetical protein